MHLTYKGKLSSREVDGASRQKEGGDWYVFTHFERRSPRGACSPCFDEPSFKVPWELTLRVPKEEPRRLTNTAEPVSQRG